MNLRFCHWHFFVNAAATVKNLIFYARWIKQKWDGALLICINGRRSPKNEVIQAIHVYTCVLNNNRCQELYTCLFKTIIVAISVHFLWPCEICINVYEYWQPPVLNVSWCEVTFRAKVFVSHQCEEQFNHIKSRFTGKGILAIAEFCHATTPW